MERLWLSLYSKIALAKGLSLSSALLASFLTVSLLSSGTAYAQIQCRQVYKTIQEDSGVQKVIESVERENNRRAPPKSAVAVNFERDSDIIIFFHPKDTASIEKNGFLNQHESGKSSGFFDNALRSQVENSISDLDLSSLGSNSLRPKSALVLGRGSIRALGSSYNPVGLYGGIGAVLKSHIKKQSLWTMGDSLQVGQEIMHGRVSKEDLRLVRGTFSQNWMSQHKDLPETLRKPEFIEALIFGKFGFDDVDHFIVQYESSALPLLQTGKPVFLAQNTADGGTHFQYKRIMSFGNTIPENLPPDQKEKILDAMERFRGKHKNPKIGLYPQ